MKGYSTFSVRDPDGSFARLLRSAARGRGMKVGDFVRISCETAHPEVFLSKLERFGTEGNERKEGEKA